MTPEQQKDAERLERHIVREGLSSVMNDIKWREARAVLKDVGGFGVKFRVKCVRDNEPPAHHWEGSFPYHSPGQYKVIEWLELETTDNRAVAEAFRAKNIPFYRSDSIITIQGYTRAGQPPV